MEIRSSRTVEPARNRVVDALLDFHEQETRYMLGNPLAAAGDLEAVSMRAQHYSSIYESYKRQATAQERTSLVFVKSEIKRLQSQLQANRLVKLWYHPFSSRLRHWLTGTLELHRRHRNHLAGAQRTMMQQYNVVLLSKATKAQGFKQSLEGPLQRMVALNQPEFYIRHFEISQPDTDYVLHCKKIPGTDIYHLNGFQAISRPSNEALVARQAESIRHNFQIGDRLNCNAVEAAALVNKRAISRGDNNWWYLDMTRINDTFPFSNKFFDLLKAIEDLPVKLHDKHITKLKEDLPQGIVSELPAPYQDQNRKFKFQVDPHTDTIQMMNSNGQAVNKHSFSVEAQQEQQEKIQKMVHAHTKDVGFSVDLAPVGRSIR
jgi:hypothetical protein